MKRLSLLSIGILGATLVGMTWADQPAVERHQYIGDSACTDCHSEYQLPLTQVHARIEAWEVRGHPVGCEGCHGAGSAHLEAMDTESIGRFAAGGVGDAACLDCHQVRALPQWHASTHAAEGVGCVDCHSVHTETRPLDNCVRCHADVEAQMQLPSHHPVREGKMSCVSCHDPHSAQEAQLRIRLRKNDVCTSCHLDKEGPFIFEHEPVQEDCSTCHTPHGSVVDSLLVANEPALCLQCHDLHFHAGYRGSGLAEVDIGGIERENPFGPEGFNMAFTTKCSQCHSRVHGSDLPSQTVSGRGRGLTQ